MMINFLIFFIKFYIQTQCVWRIESPPGTRIRFDIEVFQIAASGGGCMNGLLLWKKTIESDKNH